MDSYHLHEIRHEETTSLSYDNPGVLQHDAPWNAEQIYKLNGERTRALNQLDSAKFSWFHVRVSAIAGIGFFTDAYNLFAITLASVMLTAVYDPTGTKIPPGSPVDTGLKIAAPLGTFVGALLFGFLADTMGRKRIYGIELVIIIIGTLGQAIAGTTGPPIMITSNNQTIVDGAQITTNGGGSGGSQSITDDGHVMSIFGILIFWRFIMGLGIGGDYPSSAVIASEFAPIKIRGRMMTGVIAMQGLGQLIAAFIAIMAIIGYRTVAKSSTTIEVASVETMWRILIGFGCLPAAIALFSRFTIPETPRFIMDIEHNLDQAVQDIDAFFQTATFKTAPRTRLDLSRTSGRVQAPTASWQDFKKYFGIGENLRVLFGCAFCWFTLDFAFYGLSLNPTLLSGGLFPSVSSITPCFNSTSLVYDTGCLYNELHAAALRNLMITCPSLVGFCICFIFIDFWGPRKIQHLGFAVATVLLFIMGGVYTRLILRSETDNKHTTPLLALYIVLNVFLNFGPNTTTFIVPAELFPTRYRSTCHGIATASGKLGAILTLVISNTVLYEKKCNSGQGLCHPDRLLYIYAGLTSLGFFATYLIPETKEKSLETLSDEDQENFITGLHEPEKSARRHSMQSSI